MAVGEPLAGFFGGTVAHEHLAAVNQKQPQAIDLLRRAAPFVT